MCVKTKKQKKNPNTAGVFLKRGSLPECVSAAMKLSDSSRHVAIG